ncbi:MAG: amidohydrolase [Treponema sp.]|jgi:predicted amidohydrolase YtcJ|nr:amidohydrolase [Treponema sp.]
MAQKMLIYNAKVYLRRETFAQAVFIEGDHILAVGTNEEIRNAAPAGSESFDAEGGLLLPGFYDSHLHLHAAGHRARMIDASGVTSIEGLIDMGRELIRRLKPAPGTIISGAGLDPEKFTGEKRSPCREDLDKISTSCGVMISRHCGHTIFCNSRVLEMAGIAESAPEVAGGEIGKDPGGRPNGILRENAAALVRRVIPPPTKGELRNNLEYALDHAAAFGLSSAASYDTGGPDFHQVVEAYRDIYRERGPMPRVTLQCGVSGKEKYLDEYIEGGYITGAALHGPYLKMGPLKLFADGTLGSQTAWLRKPYRDKPESTGVAVAEPEFLKKLIIKAHARGLQTAIHTIGDAALEAMLDCFEAVTSAGNNPLRHGIIHCQITDRPLLERMARNRILALVQPIFLTHDLYITESRIGPGLASTSYAWKTMEDLGVPTSYGTDCPVETINPLAGIACALTRKDLDRNHPPEGFFPQERVDVYTAVDNYTLGSAYANFDEKHIGRIKAGYLADMVLLDKDIFTIPPEEIPRAKALWTLVGGNMVYRRD